MLRSSETLEKPEQRVRGFLELLTLEQHFSAWAPKSWLGLDRLGATDSPVQACEWHKIRVWCGGRKRVSRWSPWGRRRRWSQTELSKQILESLPHYPSSSHDE